MFIRNRLIPHIMPNIYMKKLNLGHKTAHPSELSVLGCAVKTA